ncbi:hypothetical protein [Nannocystis sp.]|uniref:hypothetical protein n=1 Tax=Nannocystis sp. TaxID=1962667 RepID=UPI0025E7D035|nr:hypothetical protein [Nannocystis sp.]
MLLTVGSVLLTVGSVLLTVGSVLVGLLLPEPPVPSVVESPEVVSATVVVTASVADALPDPLDPPLVAPPSSPPQLASTTSAIPTTPEAYPSRFFISSPNPQDPNLLTFRSFATRLRLPGRARQAHGPGALLPFAADRRAGRSWRPRRPSRTFTIFHEQAFNAAHMTRHDS